MSCDVNVAETPLWKFIHEISDPYFDSYSQNFGSENFATWANILAVKLFIATTHKVIVYTVSTKGGHSRCRMTVMYTMGMPLTKYRYQLSEEFRVM